MKTPILSSINDEGGVNHTGKPADLRSEQEPIQIEMAIHGSSSGKAEVNGILWLAAFKAPEAQSVTALCNKLMGQLNFTNETNIVSTGLCNPFLGTILRNSDAN